jgi:MtaA/CmuA family methyltransferase
MNGKQRFRTALDLAPSDRVATASPFQAYWALAEYGVTVPDSIADPRRAAEAILHGQEDCPFDALEVLWDWVAMADDLGCTSKIADEGSPVVIGHPLESSADASRLQLPDLLSNRRVSAALETARLVVDELGDDFYCMATIPQAFTWASYLRKVDHLMTDLIRHPDEVHRLLEFATDLVIEQCRVFASAGVHGLVLCDPSASGDLISPRHYLEFAAPYTERVGQEVARLGVDQILHVCGDTGKILDSIRDARPAAFSFDTAVDMGVAKEVLGSDVCLIGNVDPSQTLLLSTADEVRAETQACIEKGGAGGGLVVAAGCDIGVATPKRNLRAMLETAAAATY